MIDGLGKPAAPNSLADNRISSSPSAAGTCEVTAATMRSGRILFSRSGERTNAGRCFIALRSVNGKGTRTTSPWLKLVVDGILGVVPELERRLGGFEPGDIIRLNFQMRWQIVKEPHLVVHIQVLDRFADFLNCAHTNSLVEISSMRRGKKITKEESRKAEGKRKN
jgi:hypothetical protein